MRPRIARERGIVLVSSLLLLVLITILAVSMFKSFGIQERIAGNLREKHRALHSAESAEQYAEWWLTSGNNLNLIANCTAPLLNANLGQGQVCTNVLPAQVADVTQVPWISPNGGEMGVAYVPPAMPVSVASAAGTYYAAPRFYISLLGPAPGGQGNVYQIDAWGYGGTTDAVAEVESTYMVASQVKNLGGL